MTEAPRERLRDRLVDIVFGRPSTPEELATAREAALPSQIDQPLKVAEWGLAALLLVAFLWQRGWFPFMDSKLNSWWFMGILGVLILLRLVREQLEKHYQRRAKARMTPTP